MTGSVTLAAMTEESIHDHVGNVEEFDDGYRAWCRCGAPFEVRADGEDADVDLHDHMRGVVALLQNRAAAVALDTSLAGEATTGR